MFAPASRSLLLAQRLPRVLRSLPLPLARVMPLLARPPCLRWQSSFRAKAIYSAFPATLHHYSPRRVSSLFDNSIEEDSRPDDLSCDHAVEVAEDGLVYPAVARVSNGASFRPNTVHMQDLTRMLYDQRYLDALDEGQQLDEPRIYTVAKGTPVPSHLILIYACEEEFSLQPSGRGLSLDDLNRSLDEFYDQYAVKESAGEWFAKHTYLEAVRIWEAGKHAWMAK